MLGYMSAREAAEKWGVSERRVHKLCKDGRLDGVIRFGHSWGIPRDAEKPEDARKSGDLDCSANDSPDMMTDFFGPDAKLLVRNESCSVFQLENETGNGIVTVYEVFPGVMLCYNDLHLQKINGHDDQNTAPGTDMLVINHCREGRFECEFGRGECGYLGDGDLSVSKLPTSVKTSSFPLSHYHGISIQIDIPKAAKLVGEISALLQLSQIDLHRLKARLFSDRPYFLVRKTEAVEHIFTELYHAPSELKESYIRLKFMELLLFLGTAEVQSESGQRYFYKTRVEAVKAIRDYITTNLGRSFTLPELSALFNIPLTAMKTCFKSVFGVPIGEYIRTYRLQTAEVLLRETHDPIAEIAVKVGYDSHAKFTAAFRTYANATPTEYRKIVVRKEQSEPDLDNT